MKNADSDADGAVSKDEAFYAFKRYYYIKYYSIVSEADLNTILNVIWSYVDLALDKNGNVNLKEISDFADKVEPVLIKVLDVDGQGSVDAKKLKNLLWSVDFNQDGKLSPTELDFLLQYVLETAWWSFLKSPPTKFSLSLYSKLFAQSS